MVGVSRLAIVQGMFELFIYYMLGWLVHTVVFAGSFAALDKWNPGLLRRKRVQLEFWISALAAICSVSIPVLWIWASAGYINIVLVLVISLVTLFVAYRRLREKAIEPEQVKGDALGYGISMVIWGGLYAYRTFE